jgi:RNA polymerase sigma-70 factor (ECF subfamily)
MADEERTDVGLLEAWRGGDRQAGHRLFRRHVRSISGFFRSKVGEGGDDLTQRTFLALVEAPERFEQRSSVRTYLFAIARKQLLMHLRSVTTARKRFDPATWSVVDAGVRPDAIATRHEEHGLLLRALQSLPVDYQVALELHYFEELPIADIAAVLEEPVGTLKSRLSRGRKLLREALQTLAPSAELETSVAGELDRWLHSLPAAVQRGADD